MIFIGRGVGAHFACTPLACASPLPSAVLLWGWGTTWPKAKVLGSLHMRCALSDLGGVLWHRLFIKENKQTKALGGLAVEGFGHQWPLNKEVRSRAQLVRIFVCLFLNLLKTSILFSSKPVSVNVAQRHSCSLPWKLRWVSTG